MRELINNIQAKIRANPENTILMLLFLGASILSVLSSGIYQMTIIDLKYLAFVICIGAITAFMIIRIRRKCSYALIWQAFIALVIGGGFFVFGMLYLNQALADKVEMKGRFSITGKGTLGRGIGKSSHCDQPYVVIDFNGTSKRLVFYCDYKETVKHAASVDITYSNGCFGFTILRSKQLVE